MSKVEEIAVDIEKRYSLTTKLVQITFKNGSKETGFFEAFKDYWRLRAIYKFRFVPSYVRLDFIENFRKTGVISNVALLLIARIFMPLSLVRINIERRLRCGYH